MTLLEVLGLVALASTAAILFGLACLLAYFGWPPKGRR